MLLALPGASQEVLAGLRQFVASVVEPRIQRLQTILDDPYTLHGPDRRLHPEVLAARREIRELSAGAGYYHMFAPRLIGGGGMDTITLYAVWHDLYRAHGMRDWLAFDAVAHWATGPSHLLQGLTDEAHNAYFEEIMGGRFTLCFALSESDAGSDLWRIRTRALRTGSGWVINGEKQWITNGPYADLTLVFAVTDDEAFAARRGGITGFVVPMSSLGVSPPTVLGLYGHHFSNEATLTFKDVEVPSWSVLGQEGDGLQLALSGTAVGRIYNAARATGLAAWAIDRACEYANQRVTFGERLIEHQAVGFSLAEAARETLAAHLLGLHAASTMDSEGSALVEAAMAKSYATESAVRTIDRAAQVLGGMGLTTDMRVQEAWQEIRAVCIADGSAEMMRRLITNQLSRGRVRY